MEITLRHYEPRDLDSMTALDALCFSPSFLFGEALMRVMAEHAQALTLIAEAADGAMAGFAIAHRKQEERPDAAYLVTLDVHPEFRRFGIGSGLLRSIERLLLEGGVYGLELHVHTANFGAIRFYEEHRFRRKDRVVHFYGIAAGDAFLYTKALAAPVVVRTRANA